MWGRCGEGVEYVGSELQELKGKRIGDRTGLVVLFVRYRNRAGVGEVWGR